MNFATTLVFYCVIGGGVSAAIYLADDRLFTIGRALAAASALLFWPLYIPGLIQRHQQSTTAPAGAASRTGSIADIRPATNTLSAAGPDPTNQAITDVESELDAALASLDGWAGRVLVPQDGRFAELRAAWRSQADRIRELDQLLARPSFQTTAEEAASAGGEPPCAVTKRFASPHSRRENIERLRAVREQLSRDLFGTLAWVRDLVTQIHLAKYTGEPVSRAEELVSQIADAVEGLSEVSHWRHAEECEIRS